MNGTTFLGVQEGLTTAATLLAAAFHQAQATITFAVATIILGIAGWFTARKRGA